MSLEVYIKFDDVNWYILNKDKIKNEVRGLPVFLCEKDEMICLRNGEDRGKSFYSYYSRFFFEENYAFLGIFSNEVPIVKAIHSVFCFLKSETRVVIADEDGENIGWFFEGI